MSVIQFIKSKSFLKQLIIALVVFLIFAVAVVQWLKYSTNHNQKIEVPNLAKMSLNEVETVLNNIDLRFVIIDSASFNPDYPAKSVIEQSPEAGQFVKENRKIYLTLNPSKYPNIEMPELYGKTKRQALSQLLAIGFRVDTAAVYVKDIAKDVVRGLLLNGNLIKAGDKIPKNSLIKLKLGDGNEGELQMEDSEEVSEEIAF
ncbi:PASTA domain-containing protein [Lutibacter maritimus]|uniref:PASTA domain-containing protein n=1 Tax=Lutibacter maritimus TaxID=593133 RepID=A0A1I6SAT9_9FLAO|nr:PASTA domain-containing protein [Lutibacter maritimus]SFS73868.1 PASTA domain-containing protein [Lutibacter maritimus]